MSHISSYISMPGICLLYAPFFFSEQEPIFQTLSFSAYHTEQKFDILDLEGSKSFYFCVNFISVFFVIVNLFVEIQFHDTQCFVFFSVNYINEYIASIWYSHVTKFEIILGN